MTDPAELVRDFIATFIAAWPDGDAESLGPFFREDAVYHNMPLEPVRGRAAIVATLKSFMAMGGTVRVDVVNMVASDSVVMTERVDYFSRPEGSIVLPVMGVFELKDGAIAAWRDYFDSAHLADSTS